MSGITAILLWLLALTIITSLLRRLPWLPGIALAAGLGVLLLALWQERIPPELQILGVELNLDRSATLLGFTWILTSAARAAFMLLIWWGMIFALATTWMNADRVLIPSIPLILAALLLALCSTPMLWAPLWLVLATVFMAFPSQGVTPRLARPALRTLLAPVLAFPLFLFTAWVLSQPGIAGDDPALWANAWRSLIVGIVLLLTPVPLHGWITAQGEHAPPFAAAFVVGVWQMAVYFYVRQILISYPLIAEFMDPARWLAIIALMMMLWGGLFALGSRRASQFFGYILLWDYGATLLFWSLSGEFGTQGMAWLWMARPMVLILLASGFRVINLRYGTAAPYVVIKGASERLPITTLAVIGGSLIIFGWPIGALFPWRLSTYQLAELTQAPVFLWAMAALLLGTLAVMRLLQALTQPLANDTLLREPRRIAWLALPLFLIGLLLAIHPDLLDPYAVQLTNLLTHL